MVHAILRIIHAASTLNSSIQLFVSQQMSIIIK